MRARENIQTLSSIRLAWILTLLAAAAAMLAPTVALGAEGEEAAATCNAETEECATVTAVPAEAATGATPTGAATTSTTSETPATTPPATPAPAPPAQPTATVAPPLTVTPPAPVTPAPANPAPVVPPPRVLPPVQDPVTPVATPDPVSPAAPAQTPPPAANTAPDTPAAAPTPAASPAPLSAATAPPDAPAPVAAAAPTPAAPPSLPDAVRPTAADAVPATLLDRVATDATSVAAKRKPQVDLGAFTKAPESAGRFVVGLDLDEPAAASEDAIAGLTETAATFTKEIFTTPVETAVPAVSVPRNLLEKLATYLVPGEGGSFTATLAALIQLAFILVVWGLLRPRSLFSPVAELRASSAVGYRAVALRPG